MPFQQHAYFLLRLFAKIAALKSNVFYTRAASFLLTSIPYDADEDLG
jgi:hypothetical protein